MTKQKNYQIYFPSKINQGIFQYGRCQVVNFPNLCSSLFWPHAFQRLHSSFIRSCPKEHGGVGLKRKLIQLFLLSSGYSCGWRRVYNHNLMHIFVITLWILIIHLV